MTKAKNHRYKKRIKIGHSFYKVKYVPIITDESDNILLGEADSDGHEIKISEQCDERTMKDTLFHELQHAIYHDTHAFEIGKDQDETALEERVVNIFTHRFLQVCYDNPDLIKHLLSRKK